MPATSTPSPTTTTSTTSTTVATPAAITTDQTVVVPENEDADVADTTESSTTTEQAEETADNSSSTTITTTSTTEIALASSQPPADLLDAVAAAADDAPNDPHTNEVGTGGRALRLGGDRSRADGGGPRRNSAHHAVAAGRLGRRADAAAMARAIPTQRPSRGGATKTSPGEFSLVYVPRPVQYLLIN